MDDNEYDCGAGAEKRQRACDGSDGSDGDGNSTAGAYAYPMPMTALLQSAIPGFQPLYQPRSTAAHGTMSRASSASSRALPDRAVTILKSWMLSPEHVDHPYPTEAEKVSLATAAGITVKQLSIWFTNARKRIWVPLRQRQGKAAPTYLDSCLQRKLDGFSEMAMEVASATGMPFVVMDSPPLPLPLPATHIPLTGSHTLAELEAASVALSSQKEHLKAMLVDLEQQEARVRDATAALVQQ